MQNSPLILNKKQIFLIVFCALNLVFAFYEATFFIGNHDWDWVKGTTQVLSLNTGLFEGRYAKFILNVMLFGGQILPLLNTMVAFALLSLGSVLLVKYWKVKETAAQIIIALMPVVAPFILGWLYFPINILGNFAAVALVTGGLILAEKRSPAAIGAAIFCFLLALGVYPSVMEMMLICWCVRWLLNPPSKTTELFPSAIIILAAIAIFKLILVILTHLELIYAGHYNMQTVGLTTLISRVPEMLYLAGTQLIDTVPFFPRTFKLIGILLIIAAVIKNARRPQAICFWLIALGATVLSAFLTAVPEEVAYMPRVNFYSINFLYAGAAAVLLSAEKLKTRNLGLALSVLYLFISINQDLYAQKVWQFGKEAEEKLVERLTSRIEEGGQNRPLTPVIAGELSLRPRYYVESYEHTSPYVLNMPFIIRHIPSGMFNFYAATPLFWGSSQISEITPELYAFLKNAGEPYPSAKGLYIDGNYAIMLLTTDGIKAIQAQLP